MKSENNFSLKGEEKKLFDLLKSGATHQIFPGLVYKVARILKRKPLLREAKVNYRLKK
jgi:hypothetical protein